ncbi:hypothetical protein vseg_002699 [Gypsophila vaccaria]
MGEEKREGRDRITELPEDIKRHILSFLCTRDALATSCLSRTWRYTWVSLPCLNFGVSFFQQFSNGGNAGKRKAVAYVHWLHNLLQIYLQNREQPLWVLQRFYLHVPDIRDSNVDAYASDVVSRWILAARHNVELFSYSTVKGRSCCNRILESKILTNLHLQGCSLSLSSQDEVNLPCLKQLHLDNIVFGHRRVLDILLSTCARTLEKLRLFGGEGVKVLRLSGFSRLEDLQVMDIRALNRVEIMDAPALQYLTLIKLKFNRCKVTVASNSCSNLVKLFINGCALSDDFFNNVALFPNLKAVTLLDCPKLTRIKISSTCLRILTIEECPNLAQVELNTPKMDLFRYRTTDNNDIITLLSKCQIFRAILVLERSLDPTLDHTLWISKLVALLANFSQSIHLALKTNSKENIIIPQELRERFRPPLCGVQNLSLTVSSLTNLDVLRQLDTLLWLSPHPKNISLVEEDIESTLSIELLYEDKLKEGGSCCCYPAPAQPSNCRGCVLKDFRITDQSQLGNFNSIRKLLEHAVKKSKATACDQLHCLRTFML